MKGHLLEEFIKYAKSEFGYEISVTNSNYPDSFESIFGGSFLSLDDELVFACSEGEDNKLTYKISNSEICFSTDIGAIIGACYPIQEFELAA